MLKRGVLYDHANFFLISLRGFEIATVGIIGYLSAVWYSQQWQIPENYFLSILLTVLSTILVFPSFSLYRAWRGQSLFAEVRLFSLAWGSIFLGLITLLFFSKQGHLISRLWIALWFCSTWAFLLSTRIGLRLTLRSLRERGFNLRNVVIIGAGDLGRQVAQHLQDNLWLGLRVTAFFDDAPHLQGQTVSNVSVQGSLNEVRTFLERRQISQVWIALPLRSERRIQFILKELKDKNIPIHFIPDIFNFQMVNHAISEIANIPVINLNLNPITGVNRFIKSLEDRILAALFLLFISPLLAVIAIAIKLTSPGPIIFKQKRHGWNGKVVEIWKFRTMIVHSEAPGTFTQATQNDPRVTPLGQFLRGTSFDELPQFFNVLQGRMSLVGPRPHPIPLNESFKDIVPSYMQRHLVKPGITGWAQVNGWRGETDTLEKMKKRVEFDLFYIQNWSLWFDFKILLMTLYKGFINSEFKGIFQKQLVSKQLTETSPDTPSLKVVSTPESSQTVGSPSENAVQELDLLKKQLKHWISMGQADHAEALLGQISSKIPSSMKFYFQGTLYGNRDESREALKYYLRALSEIETIEDNEDRDYTYVRATRALAITKCKLGEDYVGAIELLENLKDYPALQSDPPLRQAIHITQTVIHYYTQNYEKVIQELEKFLNQSSSTEHVSHSQSHIFLALSYIHLQQKEQSELHFRKALYHFQNLTPDQLQNQHFLHGWMGWVKLTQELEQLAHDMVDRDFADEMMQTFKNGLTLYEMLAQNTQSPFQQAESAKREIIEQMNQSKISAKQTFLKMTS